MNPAARVTSTYRLLILILILMLILAPLSDNEPLCRPPPRRSPMINSHASAPLKRPGEPGGCGGALIEPAGFPFQARKQLPGAYRREPSLAGSETPPALIDGHRNSESSRGAGLQRSPLAGKKWTVGAFCFEQLPACWPAQIH